jgi:hypothetical protein
MDVKTLNYVRPEPERFEVKKLGLNLPSPPGLQTKTHVSVNLKFSCVGCHVRCTPQGPGLLAGGRPPLAPLGGQPGRLPMGLVKQPQPLPMGLAKQPAPPMGLVPRPQGQRLPAPLLVQGRPPLPALLQGPAPFGPLPQGIVGPGTVPGLWRPALPPGFLAQGRPNLSKLPTGIARKAPGTDLLANLVKPANTSATPEPLLPTGFLPAGDPADDGTQVRVAVPMTGAESWLMPDPRPTRLVARPPLPPLPDTVLRLPSRPEPAEGDVAGSSPEQFARPVGSLPGPAGRPLYAPALPPPPDTVLPAQTVTALVGPSPFPL